MEICRYIVLEQKGVELFRGVFKLFRIFQVDSGLEELTRVWNGFLEVCNKSSANRDYRREHFGWDMTC